MFDEVKNNQVAPSVNSRPISAPLRPAAPVRAEDIFAEVDKTAKPEVFRPGPDNASPPRGTFSPSVTGWKSHKITVFSLLFGGLLVVVAGGYFGLRLAVKSGPTVNNPVIQEQSNNTEAEAKPEIQPAAELNNAVVEPIQPVVTEPLDSDQDGLTDAEEAALGTNPNNPDTDGDGLTDREEVKVYKTDPLNPDTDGDGFSDGNEVKNGYNPKGAGKLLQINQ